MADKKPTWDEAWDRAQNEYYVARKIVYRNSAAGGATRDQNWRMVEAAIRCADLMLDDNEKNPELSKEDE